MVFLVVVSCPQSSYNIGGYFNGIVFPAVFKTSAPKAFFSSVGFFCQPCGLTRRAPDKRESARFRSIFLASGFFYISSIVHTRPLAGNASPLGRMAFIFLAFGIVIAVLLAIRFPLPSFFLRRHSFSLAFLSLLLFSASTTWSACWHFLHMGSRECQVDFVGNRLFGCGVLPAIVL